MVLYKLPVYYLLTYLLTAERYNDRHDRVDRGLRRSRKTAVVWLDIFFAWTGLKGTKLLAAIRDKMLA